MAKRRLSSQIMRASELQKPKASRKEGDKDPLREAALRDIEAYESAAGPWARKGKKVVKLYKNDKTEGAQSTFRFNILWSTVQTLRSALYARDPQPDCSRRHKDPDRVSRVAAECIERGLVFSMEQTHFGASMRRSVDDRLLPGRGQVWARYEPQIEVLEAEKDADVASDAEAPAPTEKLVYERACLDYVYWEDFGHSIERDWEDVERVWRRVYFTRAQCVKQFGATVGNAIPLDHGAKKEKGEGRDGGDLPRKACLYEVWDKAAGQRYYVSKGYEKAIDARKPEKSFTGFFPCPAPLYATLTTDSLIPTPDYTLYQDQARQIEDLTRRIYAITDALKVAGIYDAAAEGVGAILQSGKENLLIPVDSYAVLKEKGGLKGIIEFLPLQEIAAALVSLHEAKDAAKADYYEITGIADIIRGNSDPRETATAQQIKGRFAALRLVESQTDVQRFARDAVRLMGEIIAEQFSLDTLKAISGLKLMTAQEKEQTIAQVKQAAAQGAPVPPDLQKLLEEPTWEEVYALLQDNCLRQFRVDIETDSTVRMDEEQEKADRMEFLTSAGSFIAQSQEIAMASPAMRPLLAEMLMFGIRGFKTARSLEASFETALKGIEEEAKQPRPDPEMEKVKAASALEEKKAQLAAQLEQTTQDAQSRQAAQETQMEMQRSERESQQTAELERFKAQLQVEADERKAQVDLQKATEVERIKGEYAIQLEQIRQETALQTNSQKLAADAGAREQETQDGADREQRRTATISQIRSLLDEVKSMKETH